MQNSITFKVQGKVPMNCNYIVFLRTTNSKSNKKENDRRWLRNYTQRSGRVQS